MAGGVSKAFLTAYLGGDVTVFLNDGRCAVNESETLYHFSSSQCGTERLVSGPPVDEGRHVGTNTGDP